jgi:hypothetical protein
MSVSSNIRKESTESNAAQQMRSTMGQHPELAQLNDKQLDSELTSRRAAINDTDFTDDLTDTQATAAEGETDGPSQADIDEHTRASWGQASASPQVHVDDADWNRSTEE